MIMESKYISISLIIIFVCFIITLSNSRSIVKTLPGYHGDLPFILETGYIGVGENEEVQVFYYFVESQRNPSQDPLVLYFAGGPGTGALYAIIYDRIGPLIINYERSSRNDIILELNPDSWTKAANMLFVDIPAGAGFAYAKTWEASISSDSILALDAYDFLKKWLIEHPRFLTNPLYISGMSYNGGIIVPTVALEIYKGNERGDDLQLNIKGCILLSPLTDKFIDLNSRFEFAYRLALISDDIYQSTKRACAGNYVYNDPNNIQCSDNLLRVDECTSEINLNYILDPLCDTTVLDPACRGSALIYLDIWANIKDVQKALGVREGTIETWYPDNTSLHYELKKNDSIYYSYDIFSTIDYHKQLVARECQLLTICGDHDMTFPYVGTEEWVKTLNLPIQRAWEPWYTSSQVAGYRMTYAQGGYSLTYATVKGAGHGVALYKLKELFTLVDGWLASHTYSNPSLAQF